MGVEQRTTTYISVPPPPLPEFYKRQQRHSKKPSSSSTPAVEIGEETVKFKETVTAVDGTYVGRPGWVPPAPMSTIPTPPGNNDVPPLAIYHICRVCLRPRSARYHREHPIPLNGVPPPPGICRRCRFTYLEDTKKVAEVVMERESAPVKIGCITPFVPDKDIISNEEMRRMKVEKYLRGRSDDRGAGHRRSDSRKDIVFRHIKVVDDASTEESDEEVVEEVIEEVVLPRKKKVVFTSRDLVSSPAKAPLPEPPTVPKMTSTSMQVQPTQNPPSVSSSSASLTREQLRNLDSRKASVSARASSASRSGSPSTVRASAKASMYCPPGHTESELRRFAKEEIEQYAKKALEPEQRQEDIRRVAREEVARYRQAERKMEAHPDAYAHGRLVPIVPLERRIDAERDVAQTVPWTTTWKEESGAKVSSKAKSGTTAKDFAYEAAPDDSNDRPRAGTNAPPPRLEREVSIERYNRREFSPRRPEPQKDKESNPRSQTTGWEYKPQRSASSCAADDRPQESSQPQSLTKPARYIVEMSTQYPDGKRTVSEAVEEIDLPPRSRAASFRIYETDAQPPPPPELPFPDRVRELRSGSKISARQSTSYRALEPPAEEKRSKSGKQTDRDYWNDEATVPTTNTKSTRRSVAAAPGQDSDSRTPFPSPVVVGSTYASTHSRVTFQDDQEYNKTRRSRKQRLAEDGRVESSRRLPYPEVDTMPDRSTEATQPTQARDSPQKPLKPGGSSKDNDREYLYIERTVQPADRPRGSRPFDDRQPIEEVVEEETYVIRRRPQEEPRRRRRDREEPLKRESEGSTHVKFNKKVEISPTPPGSDASSSEFRSFHSIGPRGGRQIDGNDDVYRHADIVGEYERRGRTRSRNSKTQYFHEQETIHEGPDGVMTVKPKDRRKGGGKDRQAAWVSGGRPLERPLSESPSREAIIPPSRYSKSDAKGPYREQEKVADSMHAEDGSPEKRSWRDVVGESMHSSLGQAAQVFW